MADQEVPEEKKANEIGAMKTGDYMIHVYVVQGKNFKSDDCDTINPVITVEVCGETKYTSAKDNVPTVRPGEEAGGAPVNWKEHLFFEPRGRHASVIEQDTITIKVMNKGMFRDELIGIYEFDMTFVYFKEKHAFHNQWIALSNPESEDFSAVSGNLKISIAVQGPGDEQVQLNDESGPESADQETLMPASIKKEFKQLKIRFIQVEGLVDMDTFGSNDAYLKTKYQGKTMKTKPVTTSKNAAAIAQEWWLPVQWPLASDRLVIQCFDEDKAFDEIVGSMFFSLKDLVKKGEQIGGYFYWQNLYGAPKRKKQYTGANATMMDNNPELASAWMGRMLMHIECQDSKHPERKEVPLEETVKQTAIDLGLFTENEYEIIADIGLGICLPGDEKYYINIMIGDAYDVTTSKPKESKKGYNRWSERFPVQTIKSPYANPEQMDRIYVYLMSGSVPICYWKGNVTEFLDPNPVNYRWLVMKNDMAVGSVANDYEAGLIQIKMSINPKHINGTVDYKQFDAWKRPPPRRLMSKKIRCFIFQCRDIPSADEDGASDAYISVWNQEGAPFRTKTIEDSLNPIYFETVEMLYDMADMENAPPIVLNIWDTDEDWTDNSDDYLGRAVIYLDQASSNLNTDLVGDEDALNNSIPKPKWEKIRMGFDDSQPPCGEVLVSFIIARDDFEFSTPAKYLQLSDSVPTKEYSLEINILGLRQLESFGLMPIKKPFIKFRIKSLLPPEKAQAVTNVQTDPNANGPNPNINTMLTFNVQLPVEELYCPSLACDAYDYVYIGCSQPLIGTFSLPVGDIKTKQEKRRVSDLAECDEIIDYLNKQLGKSAQEIMEAAASRSTNKMSDAAKRKMKKVAKQKYEETKQKLIKQDKDGYAEQLDDDDGSYNGDEETKLVDADHLADGTTASFMGESYAMKQEQVALEQIDNELKNFLANHLNPNKMTQSDSKMKASITRRLTEQKQKLKDEQKKAAKVEAELEKIKLKEELGDGACDNIRCPMYEYDADLKVYTEKDIPPTSIYKAVGYNDLKRIKNMMEGNDEEKRATRAGTLKKSQTPKRKTMVNREQAEKEEEAQEKMEKMLDVTNLHYRKFYDDELENNKDLFPEMPFLRIPIKRGQSRGLKKSWFTMFSDDKVDESGQVSNEKEVGYFKGRIKVSNEEEEKAFKEEKKDRMDQILDLIKNVHMNCFKQPLEIELADLLSAEAQQKFTNKLETMDIANPSLIEFFKDQSQEEIIKRQLLTQTQAAVQLYIIECFDLASRDVGSASDPYMVIRFGNNVVSHRDKYQLDEANPKIHQVFEFSGTFPGAPPLEIEAWDYDDLFGDDLIGKTSIDLDDRFFSGDWQALEEKPIEYRQIYHESTSLSQGVVICWLEIEPQTKASKKEQKVWDIAPEPIKDYEVRLSVMDTKNVPNMDAEGTSDIFIKAYIDDEDKRDTDIHYRCQSGEGSFNYRINFDLKAPRDSYLLVLQAWDFDVFSSNDYICEWTLDLKPLFDNVRLTQQSMQLNKKLYDAILKKKMPKGTEIEFRDDDTFFLGTAKDGTMIKIRLDLRIVPKENALKNPVGQARQEPNQEPYLPPPVGRIEFSLNPFKMLSQLMSKEFMAKFMSIFMVVACCALLIAMAPMILSNVIGTLTLKLFGLQ